MPEMAVHGARIPVQAGIRASGRGKAYAWKGRVDP